MARLLKWSMCTSSSFLFISLIILSRTMGGRTLHMQHMHACCWIFNFVACTAKLEKCYPTLKCFRATKQSIFPSLFILSSYPTSVGLEEAWRRHTNQTAGMVWGHQLGFSKHRRRPSQVRTRAPMAMVVAEGMEVKKEVVVRGGLWAVTTRWEERKDTEKVPKKSGVGRT